MREIARRLALTRRLVATATAAAAALTGIAALGVPSALAAGSVKVTTSYVQAPISAGKGESILYAVANTTGSTVSNLTFTDTLPTGGTLGDPVGLAVIPGATTTCGAVTSISPATGATSSPGDSAVTVTVASVPSVASGAVCTVTLGLVLATPSVADVAYSDSLTSTFASPKPVLTPAGIVVLGDPALTVSRPAKGQAFKLGQVVASSFSCASTDPLDMLGSLFATDNYSNQIEPNEAIDTVDPGRNTLQVNCYSVTGTGETTESVKYKVSSYTVASVTKNTINGGLTFKSLVPTGKFVAEILHGTKVIGETKAKVNYRHIAAVSVKLNAAGKSLVEKANGKSVAVRLALAFTPADVGIGPDRITPSGPIDVTKSTSISMNG